MADTEAERTITINGKQYAASELSDAAKVQLANIRYVDREIKQAENHLSVLQAARQFYATVLGRELPSDK